MIPELSRRFGRMMDVPPFSDMTPEERLRMAAALEESGTMAEVPEPYLTMLRQAEKAREQLGAAR